MPDHAAVDVLLEHARASLDRVDPEELAAEVAQGAVVIDIRPVDQRARDGGATRRGHHRPKRARVAA